MGGWSVRSVIMIAALVVVGTPVWGAIAFTAVFAGLVLLGQGALAKRKAAEASGD